MFPVASEPDHQQEYQNGTVIDSEDEETDTDEEAETRHAIDSIRLS